MSVPSSHGGMRVGSGDLCLCSRSCYRKTPSSGTQDLFIMPRSMPTLCSREKLPSLPRLLTIQNPFKGTKGNSVLCSQVCRNMRNPQRTVSISKKKSRVGGAMGCLSPQEGVVGVWSHHCVITEGPLSSLRCPILPRGSLIVPPWLTWRKGTGPLVFKWDILVSTKQWKHWKYTGYSQRKLSIQ